MRPCAAPVQAVLTIGGRRKLRPPGAVFQQPRTHGFWLHRATGKADVMNKLPAGPAGDATLHDGRSRTVPHVEGQWSTHIYLKRANSSL